MSDHRRIHNLRAAMEEIVADHLSDCPCDSIAWAAIKADNKAMATAQHESVGWFEGTSPTPAYDPPLDAPCVVCGFPQTTPRVTISVAPAPWIEHSPRLSFYFRAHKSCWESLSHEGQTEIESSVIDRAMGKDVGSL